jgi:hypothetical protein
MRRWIGPWCVTAAWLALTAGSAAASGWVSLPISNPAGAPRSTLLAVSCSSPRACTAVGDIDTGAGSSAAMAQRWNGISWTLQSGATPAGAQDAKLTGVACPRANFCVAVGSTATGSLVERWNGRFWRTQPSPAGTLSAVSCTGPRACMAVGSLALRWNGRSWTIEPTPAPPGTQSSSLSGVSCTAASVCTAVGSKLTSALPFGIASTLAERWNGHAWRIQPTPNPGGAQDALLAGVSCPTGRACSAVGSSTSNAGGGASLAEGWRNLVWAIQSTPSPPAGPGAVENPLNAVSCTARRACTAVGNTTSLGEPAPLAERFDGAAWRLQPITLSPGTQFPFLSGVSCPTLRVCIAVGGAGFRDSGVALAERWSP